MHVTIHTKPSKTQEPKQIARFHLLTRNMFLIKIPSDICDTTSLTLIFLPFTAFCCLASIINSHLFDHRLFCKSYFYLLSQLPLLRMIPATDFPRFYLLNKFPHQLWYRRLSTLAVMSSSNSKSTTYSSVIFKSNRATKRSRQVKLL